MPDRVELTWSAVQPEPPRSYTYRVVALTTSRESEPSALAIGSVSARPVTGYEVQIDDGTWSPAGTATTYVDAQAAPPTMTLEDVSATVAEHVDKVVLAGSVRTGAGASRRYRVRALSAYGPGVASAVASGWRALGVIAWQWERSSRAVAEDFIPLPGATTPTFEDQTAPSDGATRWYRAVVAATGASTLTSAAVAGARIAPPGVPSGVRASNDRSDVVVVEWEPVDGATSYLVYRDAHLITTAAGVAGTTYEDADAPPAGSQWPSPQDVAATTSRTDGVTVTWVVPARPVGAQASYEVSALGVAGEGPRSAEALGRRAAPALVGFEVEVVRPNAAAATITVAASETSWHDAQAPLAQISIGALEATRGLHRLHVDLDVDDAAIATAAVVSYRVRAMTAPSAGTYSGSVVGRRASGPISYYWSISAGIGPSGFQALATTELSALRDTTGAPADGARRHYRVEARALGGQAATSASAEGWRLAFASAATGWLYSCALTSEGVPWCWGQNDSGQLGRGYESDETLAPGAMEVPVGVDGFAAIALGAFTCALTSEGDVYCWGAYQRGDIADPGPHLTPSPTRIALHEDAIAIGVGNNHACAVTTSRGVSCWGHNDSGQLGDETTGSSSSPVAVSIGAGLPISNVAEVKLGYSHTCARKETGELLCWGSNGSRELGQSIAGPVLRAIEIPGLTDATALAVGAFHACVLRADATVWCWGDNSQLQCGNDVAAPSSPARVADVDDALDVAAIGTTSFARTTSGAVAWGRATRDSSAMVRRRSPAVRACPSRSTRRPRLRRSATAPTRCTSVGSETTGSRAGA